VDLVVVDGDPTLRVSADVGGQVSATDDEYEARITLRLPQSLKSLVEQAADTSDESINSWVVKALASRARARSGGQHFTGVIEL
jgi:predicted HicB family RNase H-like nuclease